ncbi:MAG: protein-ADP-ribose hydrolase [Coprococcus sp.]
MKKIEIINKLNEYLLNLNPEIKPSAENFPDNMRSQRILLRSLMNIHNPDIKLPDAFFDLQDILLKSELAEKGIVKVDDLPTVKNNSRITIWQGDITRLQVDAIVNAANSKMLGCFVPCHGCIDNAIHSSAGLQLRYECASLMKAQGHDEATGNAKITRAYNLPAKYILHTVGPIINGCVTEEKQRQLVSCYHSCLDLAEQHQLISIAFCCISTGEFHFPNDLAASLAIETVSDYFENHPQSSIKKVVFNVFKDIDLQIYTRLLKFRRK